MQGIKAKTPAGTLALQVSDAPLPKNHYTLTITDCQDKRQSGGGLLRRTGKGMSLGTVPLTV
jgi:hypothetical protein